jgi:sialate O-acetylesterase
MNIIQGLAEGQVLQRLNSRGANAEIFLSPAAKGLPVLATISGSRGALKGWKARPVGQSKGKPLTVTLTGIPAGGPYRLELQVGKDRAQVRQFFVGDVWILAGQSNMEGVGDMTAPAKRHPLIRAFSMRREWVLAADPLHLLAESPDKCHNSGIQRTPEECAKLRRTQQKGVGPGMFFAHEMLRRSGVPQGLVATAHGGTSMSQWEPVNGEMYQSMLASVRATGQPAAGLLWYQGESDTNPHDAALYEDRMKKLVAATRRDFRLPGLPWVIVQIARVLTTDLNPSWNRIQELQRLLPGRIKNLETVAAIDLSLDDGIHISSQGYVTLGSRLAMAMDQFVGRAKMRPPQLLKVKVLESIFSPRIEVTFGSVSKGLKAPGEPAGFCLATPEGKPAAVIYKTTLHGNVARLHCSGLVPGLYLHYGLGCFPICNITDGRGYSLPVFGPVPAANPVAILGFVKQWKTTGLLTPGVPLGEIACPNVETPEAKVKTYACHLDGFIEEHASWEAKTGQQYFSSILELEEPMKLRFLMGYDGPFRLWLNEELFFQDLKGTNPALPDARKKSVSLPAGRHRLTVAMDTNEGMAWGFFLRFVREGVSPAQLKDNSYKKPVYTT